MQQVFRMRDADGEYDVPESEVANFKRASPNAVGVSGFRDKDGDYDVPDTERDNFKRASPDAQPIRRFRMDDGGDIDVDERAIARLRKGQIRNPFAPIGTDREAERASVSRKAWKEAGLPEKYGRSQKDRDEVSRLILDAYDNETKAEEAARAARQNGTMAQLDATRPAFEAQFQRMQQTQREFDYQDALAKAEAARPDIGVFGHKYLEAVAAAGRDVGAGELIARQLPVLGAFIDADDAMVNNNFRRFMNGEFKDSLAMGNAARNMGVPEDVIADVQRRSWSGERTAAGFPIVDQKKAAEEWRKVIEPMYMAREAAKGRAVETLQEAAPLTATQEILSGAMTLPKMVVDLTPLGAGVTAIPKMAAQAENLVENGDSEGTALAKSAASIGGEYLIWNKLGKVIDALPGVGNAVKSVGQALARNKVTGNVIARNAGQILEMNAKSGLTELVNDVAGMGKADSEEKKAFSEWFQDFVSVPGNAKKMLMMLPAHLLMKGVGKGKQMLSKEGREAAGAVDAQREIVKATIGDEAARGLSDADVQNIYKIVSSPNLTEKSISDTLSFIEGKAGTENRQGALRELRKKLREGRELEGRRGVAEEGARAAHEQDMEARKDAAMRKEAARRGITDEKEVKKFGKLYDEYAAEKTVLPFDDWLEERKAAPRAENEAAREAKRTAKSEEAADAARAEQERLQAEAEQEAAIKERAEEEARPNAAVEEMKAAEAEAAVQRPRTEEYPEYAEWLKKNGMKDTDKHWNKFVAKNEWAPSLKVGQTEGEVPNTSGQGGHGTYTPKLDAERQRIAEKKAAAKEAERIDHETKIVEKSLEAKKAQQAEMEEYERQEAERKRREAEFENRPIITVGREDTTTKIAQPPTPEERLSQYPEYAEWIGKNGRKNNDKNWRKFVMENGLDPALIPQGEIKKPGAPPSGGKQTEPPRPKAKEPPPAETPKNAPTSAPREEVTTTPPNGAEPPQGGKSAENATAGRSVSADTIGGEPPAPTAPPSTPAPEPKKPFGTGDSSHGTGKYSRKNYDSDAANTGATGAATWHWQNGERVYSLPVDLSQTRPGGPVVLDKTDSAYERINELLNGRQLVMTKSGKIQFKGEFKGAVPKELRELLGRELKIGKNPDAPSKDDLYSVNKGQFGEETRTTWDEVEKAVAADRENYHNWQKRRQRADRRASEEKKLEKKVKSGKATQNELDILRHRNMMEDYLEEGGKETDADYKAMERDLEVLQESGTYDYEGLSKAKDAADMFRDAEWENAIGDIESGEGDFSPSDQYVKPFTRENLQGAKKGDIIHFDHDEMKYELDRYDPETGVMDVYRSDENGVKRRFKVSRNGVEEIRNDGKGQKGVVQDNAGDAGGGGRPAPGAAGGEARGAEGAGAGRGAGGTGAGAAAEKVAELTAKAKALAKEYAALSPEEQVGSKGRELERRVEEAWDAVEAAENASAGAQKETAATMPGARTAAPQGVTPELKERAQAAIKVLKGDTAKPVAELKRMLADAERRSGPAAERKAQALRDFIAYKEAAETNPKPPGKVGGSYAGRTQMQEQALRQRLQDQKFKDWAKRHGVTPTKDHLEMYDREQAKGAFAVAKRWIRGIKAKFESRPPTDADLGANDRAIRNVRGDIIGKWDKAAGEVTFYPGANAETVAHEIGWHATYDHAEKLAAQGDRRLLDKLNAYARGAQQATWTKTLTRYGMSSDPRMLLDEVGAARFTAEQAMKIKNETDRRAALKWYGKAWEACRDAYKSMLTKMGFNKTSVDALNGMSPERAVEFMATEMARGKTLAKVEAKKVPGVNDALTAKEKYVRAAKDSMHVLKWVDEVTGGRFHLHRDQKLSHGMKQKAFDRAMQFWNEMATECKAAGIKLTELDEYIRAKGAADTNRRIKALNGNENGAGISDVDAARTVLQYERGAKGAAMKRIAQKLWDLQHEGLMERVNAGLVDAQFAADLEANEPFHVPRHNRFDANGEFTGYETNAQLAANEWHKAEGRTTDSANAVGWIMQEYCDAFSRGAENRVRQRLAQALLASNGVLGNATVVTPANEARLAEKTKANKNGNAQVVIVKQGGKKVALELNGVRGEAVARALTGRDMKEMPSWVKKTLRIWASTATEWSPTFALRNLTADLADVMLLNIGDHGIVKGLKRDAGHIKAMATLARDIRQYVKTGKTNNALLNEAIGAGILIGGMGREGFADPNEAHAFFQDRMQLYGEEGLKRAARRGVMGAKNIAKRLFGWVETINKTTELMNRLADYKKSRDMGMSARDAAAHARDITVDFNEKGEWTGVSNALYMFSNSTMGAAFRQVKGVTGKHWKGLVGTALAIGFAEGLAEVMNGDEDDADKAGTGTGKDVNEYTRANSLYLRFGNTTVRTPFHAGPLSVIKYTGNCAARYMAGLLNDKNKSAIKGSEAAANIGKEASGLITHFLGLGDAGPNVMQTITPSVLQWLVQLGQNRDYADRPIAKPKFDEAMPSSENGRRSTAEGYKDIARLLNEWSGGNAGRKGSVDYAPEQYKVVAEAVGKNVLRDVTSTAQTIGYVIDLFRGNADIDTRNIPVVRDFVRVNHSGNTQRYYEAATAYREDRYELQKMVAQWTPEERKAYVQAHPWARNPEVNKAIQKIGELQKYEDGFVKNGRGWVKRKTPPTEEQKAKWKAARLRYQARFLEYAEKHGGEH